MDNNKIPEPKLKSLETVRVMGKMIDLLLELEGNDNRQWVIDSIYNLWHNK